jgi:hypothetical protein
VLCCRFFYLERQAYVSVELQGQFGNQLFQIATAYAYALDYHRPLIIPQLATDDKWNIQHNAKRLFLDKIEHHALPLKPVVWKERSLSHYKQIPSKINLQLKGYFHNEQYFKHRRKEILELFAPPEELKQAILTKYPVLASTALTVGVQVRDYRQEYPQGDYHPTHGREYYEKAFAEFPDEAIFFVSSNDLAFAKECTSGLKKQIIYLDEQDYLKEFYTLTLCKSFVISNSSFGWWAAWLSTSPDKTVIVPKPWFSAPYRPNKELCLLSSWVNVIESSPLSPRSSGALIN